MDYLKFIISNQKDKSISIQRVKQSQNRIQICEKNEWDIDVPQPLSNDLWIILLQRVDM